MRPVLIVGTNIEALTLHAMLRAETWHGYRVVGFLGEEFEDETAATPVLGPACDAVAIATRTGVTGVLIATTSVDFTEVNRLARDLTDAGFHVELSSALYDIAPERLQVRPLGSFPFCYIEPVRRYGWRRYAKRASDLLIAAAGLVVTAPLFALFALLIKVDSRGPVFFRQERLGRDGSRFRLVKFRTMVDGAEQRQIDLRERNEASGPLFKVRDDPRITRVGRFLRRSSLDELPQLLNVLRGEMSMVGPRPALPSEIEGWHEEAHARLRVKPGVTGMWQVSGRSDSSFEQYIRLDLYYVDNWSLLTDLAILAKTIPTVLLRRGAY
jgi:exopolysaccharide biosynthesis polyprenyl glycosylphosphotransferase